jgi:transcriptional regulator with XRE-family HTH domain
MSGACDPGPATIRTGLLLRRARENADLTQRQLADRLGCTQPAVSQAEAGGAALSIATLQRFADALGCDLQVAIVSRDAAFADSVPATLRPRG